MLLNLSEFSPFVPLHQAPPFPLATPPFSSCPWVMHRFFGYSVCYTVLYIPMAILPVCTSASPHLFAHSPITPSHLETVRMLSVYMIMSLFLFD